MDKTEKKQLFRRYVSFICATALLLGGFMYLPVSCEREDVSGNGRKDPVPTTGEMVTVNITAGERSVGIQDVDIRKQSSWASLQNADIQVNTPPLNYLKRENTSPALDGSDRVEKPVTVQLVDDVYMHATLQEEETPVKLRSSSLLSPGIKVRVVAYTGSGYTTKLDHGDYVIVAGGALAIDGTPPLTVPAGSTKFVAYSFNDTITLPAFVDPIVAIGSRDLLWGDTIVTVSSVNTSVHIVLDHLFSRIKLRAAVDLAVGNYIDAMGIARFLHTYPSLSVQSGNLTPGTSGYISFTWPATGSAQIWNSHYHPVFTNGSPPVLQIGDVTIDSTPYPGPWTVNYTTPLATGREYTLNVTFKAGETFSAFWYQANFGSSGVYPWSVTRLTDQTGNYIFPWNTAATDIDVESNLGCTFDNASSSTGTGVVSAGTSFVSGSNTVYPYTFTLNNTNYTTTANYSLVFASNPAGSADTLSFRRGIQAWSRAGTSSISVGYKGLSTPTNVTVTDNIVWSYWFNNWMHGGTSVPVSTWAKARVGTTSSWVTPTAAGATQQDDRLTAPVAYSGAYPASGILTKDTTLQVTADAASGPIINAQSGSALATRSALLNFQNQSSGGTALSPTLTISQYLPRAYVTAYGGPLPVPQICGASAGFVPSAGGTYTLTVSTNVDNLGVRVYGLNSLTGGSVVALVSSTTVSPANDAAGSNVTITVNIPSTTFFRTLSFYFYSTSAGLTETKFAEVIQDGGLIGETGTAVSTRIYISGSGDNARALLTQSISNMGALFQFGGILGWQRTGTLPPPAAVYNPTASVSSAISMSWTTGLSGGLVPHTLANLRNGIGDPCRLVGFTVAQIKEAVANGCVPDNKKYRTPTGAENQALGASNNAWTNDGSGGIYGRWFNAAGSQPRQFLPGNGPLIIDVNGLWAWAIPGNGANPLVGSGAYWDGDMCVTHRQAHALAPTFMTNSNGYYSHSRYREAEVLGVRCVPQ